LLPEFPGAAVVVVGTEVTGAVVVPVEGCGAVADAPVPGVAVP
jgi:hypothetical protein